MKFVRHVVREINGLPERNKRKKTTGEGVKRRVLGSRC